MNPYETLLERLSVFLNRQSDFITGEMMDQLRESCNLEDKACYALLLASALGIDPYGVPWEREAARILPKLLHPLRRQDYEQDAYLTTVHFPEQVLGHWEFRTQAYAPYEAFVCNDFEYTPQGDALPQIGYFPETFSYPAVLQDAREWMTVTPNEIATMAPAITESRGNVLTFGLGLGYYAFHTSLKKEVESVTVVERDGDVIRLFKQYLLPQFPCACKIRVVQDDAFAYARNHLSRENYDTVFTDLWHDPSDGVELYLKMKKTEELSPNSRYLYWIEKTLRYYL